MPGNVKKMLDRTLIDPHKLKEDVDLIMSGQVKTRTRRGGLHENSIAVAKQIYLTYTEPTVKKKIRADELRAIAHQISSRTTLRSILSYLGISRRRYSDGIYYMFPRYSPSEAEYKAHIRNLREADPRIDIVKGLRKPSSQALVRIMENANYMILASLGRQHMEKLGYAPTTINQVKARVGVATYKIDGKWYWMYITKEHREWLLTSLQYGPRPIDALTQEALAELGWHPEVVYMTKRTTPQVKYFSHLGVPHYRDINVIGSLEGDNIVEVDFTEEPSLATDDAE